MPTVHAKRLRRDGGQAMPDAMRQACGKHCAGHCSKQSTLLTLLTHSRFQDFQREILRSVTRTTRAVDNSPAVSA